MNVPKFLISTSTSPSEHSAFAPCSLSIPSCQLCILLFPNHGNDTVSQLCLWMWAALPLWFYLYYLTPYCQIQTWTEKVGKTTRPFRYNLNHIPYDYTVEVTDRFKRLYLIECLKNYEWRFMTLYRRQWSRPSPRKRNEKWKNDCLRRPYK